MNTHDIELPAEFRSGNDIPVTQATIKRERMEEILQATIEADRQRRGEPVLDFPLGAIENGRTFADRLETDYSFECLGGPLRNCSDWQEFRHCFDHLAKWVMHQTSKPAEPDEERGFLTITWDEDKIGAVTRQDSEGKILSVIAVSGNPPFDTEEIQSCGF